MTPRSGCHGGEGSCPRPLPKNSFGRAKKTPNPVTPPPSPKFPGGGAVPGFGTSAPEGWDQLSCLWPRSQVPGRTTGTGRQWVMWGDVSPC